MGKEYETQNGFDLLVSFSLNIMHSFSLIINTKKSH